MQRLLIGIAFSGVSLLHARPWPQPLREVEKPHYNPYQQAVGINFGYSCTNCHSPVFAPPPEGKRLVMEFTSINVQVPEGGASTRATSVLPAAPSCRWKLARKRTTA